MPKVCILTDSTAQFTRPNFPGHERVFVIPFNLEPVARQDVILLPRNAPTRQLVAPTPQEFLSHFSQLGGKFDAILTITLSSCLSPTASNAQSAAITYSNHVTVLVVDSQTTAIGLGLLVQTAAAAAISGASLAEVERRVRAAIPQVFMLFCVPELTYLAEAGYMSYPQALIGEMMGLLPIFALEEGRLIPMEKVRTQRHLFESFQEFMDEFESPHHVALMRGVNHNTLRTRPLREYVQENFPQTAFSEHAIGAHLAALFGPQSIGLVVIENPNERLA